MVKQKLSVIFMTLYQDKAFKICFRGISITADISLVFAKINAVP